MEEFKQRFLLGIDITPRKEYRNRILVLEATADEYRDQAAEANKRADKWVAKHNEMKVACDTLRNDRDDWKEKASFLRSRNAELDNKVAELNDFIQKLKSEIRQSMKAVDDAQGTLVKAKKEIETQTKAYIELAHDYDVLKEEYDAILASKGKETNSVVESPVPAEPKRKRSRKKQKRGENGQFVKDNSSSLQ